MNGGIRIDKEGVSRIQFPALVLTHVHSLPADDMVQEKVVPHSRTPAVAGSTLLTARILDIE